MVSYREEYKYLQYFETSYQNWSNLLQALTMKLSIFKNKQTSHQRF